VFQSGRPLNNSPSHQTVPASMASRSVSDIGGRVFLNQRNNGVVNHLRRASGSSRGRALAISSSQNTASNQPGARLAAPMTSRKTATMPMAGNAGMRR